MKKERNESKRLIQKDTSGILCIGVGSFGKHLENRQTHYRSVRGPLQGLPYLSYSSYTVDCPPVRKDNP